MNTELQICPSFACIAKNNAIFRVFFAGLVDCALHMQTFGVYRRHFASNYKWYVQLRTQLVFGIKIWFASCRKFCLHYKIRQFRANAISPKMLFRLYWVQFAMYTPETLRPRRYDSKDSKSYSMLAVILQLKILNTIVCVAKFTAHFYFVHTGIRLSRAQILKFGSDISGPNYYDITK